MNKYLLRHHLDIVIIIMLSIIVLMIYPSTQEAVPNIQEIVPNVQEIKSDGYFSQKKICAEMDIHYDIKQNWWESRWYSLDEIFYSPSIDTCIAIVSFHQTVVNEETWLYDMLGKRWFMVRGTCAYLEWDSLKTCTKNNSRFDAYLESIKPI